MTNKKYAVILHALVVTGVALYFLSDFMGKLWISVAVAALGLAMTIFAVATISSLFFNGASSSNGESKQTHREE